MTSVRRPRSIGLGTAHSPASSGAREATDTKMTGISRSRASARTARSTSKPFIPGMKTSSVIASKCSWRSRASASVPECDLHGVHPQRPQLLGDERRERRLVVDDEHAPRRQRGGRRAVGGCRASPPKLGADGSRTVNVVPTPTVLCTSIVPPCRSTSDLTIASPRPVPGLLRSSVEPR